MKILFALLLILGYSGLVHGGLRMPRNCQYSDAVYNRDLALAKEPSPARFRLMPGRWVEIIEAARGAACTGTVTVAWNGHEFFQAGRKDDAGLAELIPLLSSYSGFNLSHTFDLTVAAFILLGIASGYAGFWRMYPDRQIRMAGAGFFLCAMLAEAVVGDVYVFQCFPLIAGIPWVIYFAAIGRHRALEVSAALLVMVCGLTSIVRIGTLLIGMAFLVTLFLARGLSGRAIISLIVIGLTCIPCVWFEHALIARRNSILFNLGNPAIVENEHTIWHAIYVGLAFIPNKDVPAFDDEVAFDRARLIDPGAIPTSTAYETILRHEVFLLAKRRPLLLLANVLSKTAFLLLIAMALLFPSRKVICRQRRTRWIDAPFICAMTASAMNAVLVEPRPAYLLTFICIGLLYSAELSAVGKEG